MITINRPKVLNALNPQVVEELSERLQGTYPLTAPSNARCITGAGKAFVAGADISAMRDMDPLQRQGLFPPVADIDQAYMEEMAKPIIAAANGFASGRRHRNLAMACDFIYASEKAMFGQPEINLGVVPGAGGTQRLSRLVGKNMARELCMTGELINAERAKEIGLVNKVVHAGGIDGRGHENRQGRLASKGRVAMRAVKRLIVMGYELPMDQALRLEAESFGMCFASPDQKEGMSAFLEKRKPEFKGELLGPEIFSK